jgi:hypothetical protein
MGGLEASSEQGMHDNHRRGLLDVRRLIRDVVTRVTTAETDIVALDGRLDVVEPVVALQTDRMSCSLTNSAGQSLVNAAFVLATFDTETFDVGGLHAGGSPTRITVPVGGAGLWLFSFHLLFDANVSGSRIGYMRRSGGGSDRLGLAQEYYSGWDTTVAGQWVGRMVDTEYMELVVYQDSGGALNLKGDDSALGALQFAAVRLGD